jgi:hypothetical protein
MQFAPEFEFGFVFPNESTLKPELPPTGTSIRGATQGRFFELF